MRLPASCTPRPSRLSRHGQRPGGHPRPRDPALQRQGPLRLGGRRPGSRHGQERPGQLRRPRRTAGQPRQARGPPGHEAALPRLPARGRVPLPRQGRQLRGPRPRVEAARALQDVPPVDRGPDEQRGRRRLLVHPGEHRGPRHGEAPSAKGDREVGRGRGRRPTDPQPDRRLREAPRAVEHHGDRGPRQDDHGLGQRRQGERRLRQHRRSRQDRDPGRGHRGRVPRVEIGPLPPASK